NGALCSHLDMLKELQDIFRDVYIKERRLNLLYGILIEAGTIGNGFFVKAREDQSGDLQMLQEINLQYGNQEIDSSILEKMGESLVHLRSSLKEREDLMREILTAENELVELYKNSLRFLTSDDQTRRLINRILTVKLFHKRELMDSLQTFTP
ncbi:MAG: hypothetical protein NT028_01975, partial [candidate division Zixibacteria bacterium]|nr:hypothetical protein [candidate division Zixibacteria bacterium]